MTTEMTTERWRNAKRVGFLVLFTLWSATGALAQSLPSSERPPSVDNARSVEIYRDLREVDRRVARVFFRLSVANAPLCLDRVMRVGAALVDIRQFPVQDQKVVRTAFALDGELGFEVVDPDGPAGKAGIRDGDGITAINGADLVAMLADKSHSAPTSERVEIVQRNIDRAPSDIIDLVISRNGTAMKVALRAEAGCASSLQVAPDNSRNASADDHSVRISTGMAALAIDDTDLAIILAHELAHNILGHRKRLNDAGVDRGLGRMFGRNRRLIRDTEEEADRLSLYLLANAGYDIDRAPVFWLGPARHLDGGLLSDGTHPCPACRAKLMEIEIAKIRKLPKEAFIRPLF